MMRQDKKITVLGLIEAVFLYVLSTAVHATINQEEEFVLVNGSQYEVCRSLLPLVNQNNYAEIEAGNIWLINEWEGFTLPRWEKVTDEHLIQLYRQFRKQYLIEKAEKYKKRAQVDGNYSEEQYQSLLSLVERSEERREEVKGTTFYTLYFSPYNNKVPRYYLMEVANEPVGRFIYYYQLDTEGQTLSLGNIKRWYVPIRYEYRYFQINFSSKHIHVYEVSAEEGWELNRMVKVNVCRMDRGD